MSIFFSDDPASNEGPPPPPPQRRRVWPRRALAVLGVTLVVTLAAGAIYVGSVSRSFTSNVSRSQLLLPLATGCRAHPRQRAARDPSDKPKSAGDPINYVLMGSDSQEARDASAGRSDSLMILHLAGDRQSAHLISFPRDMYVYIPGHGKNKINAAFSFGGPPLAVQTFRSLSASGSTMPLSSTSRASLISRPSWAARPQQQARVAQRPVRVSPGPPPHRG